MKKPIIGIVLDSAKDSEKYSYAPFPWYTIRKCYVNAVIDAGGIPILLQYHPEREVLYLT